MSKCKLNRKWLAAAGAAALVIANALLWQSADTAKLLIVDVAAASLLLLLCFAKRFTGGVRTLVTLSLLCALSVVLSRILAINTHSIRISLGNVPILLAGLLYGPFAGALVGFAADLIGSLALSSFGYMPLLAISPVLVGGLPGLLKPLLLKNGATPLRLGCVVLITEIVAPICWTTYCLNLLYGTPLGALLATRIPLYLCMGAVEAGVIWLMLRAGAFKQQGLLPVRREKPAAAAAGKSEETKRA